MNFKSAANWVMGEVMRLCKDTGNDIDSVGLAPERLGELIKLIDKGIGF